MAADKNKSSQKPLLIIDNIVKHFGAVQAIKGVSFEVRQGEVLALVGDNGAGKSTLIKIVAGVHEATSGKMWMDDKEVVFRRPADAREAGIETVYQHLALVEQLDVADNVYLGREEIQGGWIGKLIGLLNYSSMREKTTQALNQLHINIPAPTMPVRRMSGGQRQAVAIGRAVTWGQRLLILDEPTAALGVEETEQVLSLIEKLRDDRGMTFLIISHNMQDVYRIADRIVVLRQGTHVATLNKDETSPEEIVAYITGARASMYA